MKNKVLFIGFMILFVISQKIASTQTTIECRPQAATDWTGYAWKTLYTIYGKSDGEIQVGQDLTDKERGWAKIDISAIPLDAIITDITLKLYVNSPSTSSNHDLVIRKVSSDPVSTSASTLYNQIGTGTWYGYDGNAGVSSGYKYIDLEPVAISDLQTIVSNNSQEWFAIGFWEWDDDVNSCDIDGWDWSSNPSNSNAEPILIVDYDTPSCSVSVPSGNLVSSSSGNINFSVTSNGISNWSASESCNWLSISPTSGNGNGTITITYEENMASLRQCNINVSCGSSTDTYTLTQDQVDAINDVEYFDKINIIPNPNSGRFILEIETAKAIDLQLKLFNVFGQLMYEDKLGIVSGTIKKNVSVGNFPAGVYTIQLSSMESVVSRMILVE